ncbi:MAG: hypothetical protein V5A88_04810 [Candidatus Thermoplasmatota archaeon]
MTRRLKREDEKGALEGLPLYLIILVVIAGVGTAIIAGWMMSAQSTELDHIEIDDKEFTAGTNNGVTITAYDQDNEPLEDATVTLEGCGVVESETTDSNGEASFSNINPDLGDDNIDYIDVTVKYEDRTETDQIVVT